MSESKTPTPRTDEHWDALPFENRYECLNKIRDFARTLELELNEAKEAFQKQRENYIKLYEAVVGEGCVVGWPDPVQIATELRSQLTTAQQELKTLKLKCGLCICPEHTTDQACVSCVTEQPNVFQQLEHAQQEIAELRKAASALTTQIIAEGGHGYAVHELARNVTAVINSAMRGTHSK